MAERVEVEPLRVGLDPLRRLFADRLWEAAVWGAIAVTTVMRFTVGASRSLWMDETWTAMIASQPTIGEFVKQCFYDTNAPLYYVVTAVAAKVLGYSDLALRLPATVFGAAAPVAAMLFRLPGPRAVKYTWAVLLACWIPGLWFSQNARCYTLLLMLAVMNCSLFANALEERSSRRFGRWAVVSSLMILTHYYAALLVALQFAAFLPGWRKFLGRFWPGLLAFVPAAVAMAISSSKFLLFTNDHLSWIPRVSSKNIYPILSWTLGAQIIPVACALWAALCLAGSRLFTKVRGSAEVDPAPKSIWFAAALSLASVAIALGVGVFKGVVDERYLTAYVPGLLLALSAFAATAFAFPAVACRCLGGIFLIFSLIWPTRLSSRESQYNIEDASYRLMAYNPQRVVFLWDSQIMLALSRSSENFRSLEGVGGFFFARAGKPVKVDAVDVKPGVDPNPLLLEHAKPAGSVIIWVRVAKAKQYAPRLQAIDPSWRCEKFSYGAADVFACHKVSAGR